jgi:general secretion pathway protein A
VACLHSVLIDEHKQGRTVVLIIDEAQSIPLETLQALRMLSNLETSTRKLIQMILVGQPEFEERLNREELRQLKQRVALRCKIYSLTRAESITYIEHRLSRVAPTGNRVFTRGALRTIVTRARGVPRTINILCDNALMTGFRRRKKPVPSGFVKKVIADLEGHRRPRPWRRAAATVSGLLVIAMLAWWSPLKERLPLRGSSQTGSQGMIVSSIKERGAEELKQDRATSSLLPVLEEVATALEQELNLFEKPRGLEGIQDYIFPRIITVKKGDNLFRLTLKVYGYANERLLEWVLVNNPQIKSPTQIAVGARIVFPDQPLDHEWTNGRNPAARPEKISEQTLP